MPSAPRGGGVRQLSTGPVAIAAPGADAQRGDLWPRQLSLRGEIGATLAAGQPARAGPGSGRRALLYAGTPASDGGAGHGLVAGIVRCWDSVQGSVPEQLRPEVGPATGWGPGTDPVWKWRPRREGAACIKALVIRLTGDVSTYPSE